MLKLNHRFDHLIDSINEACTAPLSFTWQYIIIIVCCVLGLLWAVYNMMLVLKIKVREGVTGDKEDDETRDIPQHQKDLLIELGTKISEGAKEFLKVEYLICLIFAAIMFIVITFLTEEGLKTAIAFLVGAIVSIICGAVGMIIATQANFRTTYCARNSLAPAFRTAYRAGVAMGFALVSLGLLILMILILIYKAILGLDDFGNGQTYYRALFESIAGYGLGGSFVALFGRVGGGIYTKAADVGADLVGKVQSGLPEDSPKNPATIADNVGDNVGDVAGMSADLFGSFAESTCAALVISSTSLIGNVGQANTYSGCSYSIANFMFPLMIIALGIFFCIFVSMLSTHCMSVNTQDKVQSTLKMQLIVSTILLIGVLLLAAWLTFPANFSLMANLTSSETSNLNTLTRSQNTYAQYANLTFIKPWICSLIGLISGMIIAAFTEYVTSHGYGPVRELADSCKAGPASNVTIGLALGYMSTLIPVIFITITAYFASTLLGFYGVAIAALGMLANLPLSLAIDGYGPISDNAGGIAEMAEMGPEVRERTDGLDAAGNTTAAIGKGFAIGSAALVSLALYGGFLHNAGLEFGGLVSLVEPQVFAGLLLGAMIPYIFSAFTIKSVGKAAFGMVQQVRRQIREQPGILTGHVEPDYKACIAISTKSSLIEMIIPGLLVILAPLFIGFVFGPKMLAGFLPGAIVSGVQMAISAANTGGAWDNAKKYIESGAMTDDEGRIIRKGSEVHKAAVVGDTVGDPLKDTSGPALNILMKLMAIISLIFGSKFAAIHPVN